MLSLGAIRRVHLGVKEDDLIQEKVEIFAAAAFNKDIEKRLKGTIDVVF